MTTAVLTPYRRDLAKNLGGRLFRKQLLPVGSINYKGRTLDFTRDYLADLANAFEAKAYDAVKFLLAPSDNTHTMDPERMRGTLRGVELADDGLYGYLDLSDDAAQLVTEHPDLGVSARIVEGLARADGKTFPRAIQHVLGTLDPRVTGMKPWEAVDLAGDDVPTVDLTDGTYTQEGATMPEITEEQKALLDRLAALPADRIDALLTPPTADTEPSEAEITAALDALEVEANTEPAELSAEAQAAIDLAKAQAEQANSRASDLERALARQSWAAQRAELAAAGVPPADLDLATPLLEQPTPAVIDLANDEKVDATEIVRRLLDARKGTVDLSREVGTSHTAPDDSDAQAALEAWERQYPAKR